MDLLGHVKPYNYNSIRIWMDKIPLQVCQLLNDGRIGGHSSYTIVQHWNLGCRGSIKILDLDTCKVMGLKCTRSPMHLLMGVQIQALNYHNTGSAARDRMPEVKSGIRERGTDFSREIERVVPQEKGGQLLNQDRA